MNNVQHEGLSFFASLVCRYFDRSVLRESLIGAEEK